MWSSQPIELRREGLLDAPNVCRHRRRALQAQSIDGGNADEMHPDPLRQGIPRGDPCWHLWPPRSPTVASRQGLLPRFLLVDSIARCGGGRPHMRGVPVLHSADPLAGADASDHPPHMAIHCLGSQPGQASQEGPWRFHSPTRRARQVYHVD
jgi:hypothetical protein